MKIKILYIFTNYKSIGLEQVTDSSRRLGSPPRKSGISPLSLLLCRSLVQERKQKQQNLLA